MVYEGKPPNFQGVRRTEKKVQFAGQITTV